jgi:hypothetical protein
VAKVPVLSPEAVSDLEEIWLYIAPQSIKNAHAVGYPAMTRDKPSYFRNEISDAG